MKTLNYTIILKLKVLSIITIIILTQSCMKEEYDKVEHKTNYYYLTAAQLNQTPYFTNPAFDTISFASDKGDTLTFVKTKTDTTWYKEKGNIGSPDCGYDQNFYQTIHNTYTSIKGIGNLDVWHIRPISNLSSYLKIYFNGYTFIYQDNFIGNLNYSRYLNTYSKNNKVFTECIYNYNQYTDSLSAKSYINKTYGVFFIEDRINNQEYLIAK